VTKNSSKTTATIEQVVEIPEKKNHKSWIDNPGKITLAVALVGGFLVLLGQLAATTIPIWFGTDLSDYTIICNPPYHEFELNTPIPIPQEDSELGNSNNNGSANITAEHNLTDIKEVDWLFKRSPKSETRQLGYTSFIFDTQKNREFFNSIQQIGDKRDYIFASGIKNSTRMYMINEFGIFSSNVSINNLHPLQKYKHAISLIVLCPIGFKAFFSNPTIGLDQSSELIIIANITYLKNKILKEPEVFTQDEGLVFSIRADKTFTIEIQSIGADGKRRNSTMLITIKSDVEKGISATTELNSNNSSITRFTSLFKTDYYGVELPSNSNIK